MARTTRLDARAQMNELRRRLLEEDAQRDAAQRPVSGPAQPSAAPGVAAPADPKRAVEDGPALGRLFADRFEQAQATRGEAQRDFESVRLDIEADRQELAGRHLRVKDHSAVRPTGADVVNTLAAQRQQQARSQRRVVKKTGSRGAAGDFGHLPHPGMWKAQPISVARAQSRAAPPPAAPAPRQAVAFE